MKSSRESVKSSGLRHDGTAWSGGVGSSEQPADPYTMGPGPSTPSRRTGQHCTLRILRLDYQALLLIIPEKDGTVIL